MEPATGDRAQVEIITFVDFECPFCDRAVATLRDLHAKYGERLRVRVLHLPLELHAHAMDAAIAAEAAHRQGAFWPMFDVLFEHQAALAPVDLRGHARQLGLDLARFERDVLDPALAKVVTRQRDIAVAVGAKATPAFFVNGTMSLGVKSFASYSEQIDAEVAVAEARGRRGDAWLRERLAENSSALHDLVYAGKEPPRVVCRLQRDRHDDRIRVGDEPRPLAERVNTFEVVGTTVIDGVVGAPLQVVVFADFHCPFSSRVIEPLAALKAKYGSRLALVFKQNPLSWRTEAMVAAVASLCAHAQGRFWSLQGVVRGPAGELVADTTGATLRKVATSVGLDVTRWEVCWRNNPYRDQIAADLAEGRAAGVTGTPMVFFNGRKFTSPRHDLDGFSDVIERYILGR